MRVKGSRQGLEVTPESRWEFLGRDGVIALSTLWLIVAGFIGAAQLASGSTPLGAVLLIAAVIGGIPALIQVALEAIGYLILLVVLPIVVICFPLLFLRSVRRALGKLWNKPLKTTHHLTRSADIAEVRVHPGPVVDVIRHDGSGVRLSANGKTGARLRAEVAKLRAAGVRGV